MIWSITGGQALDMVYGAISNLRNWVLDRTVPCLPGCSQIECYASNTINVWMNTAAYAGVPRLLLTAVAIVLIAIAGISFILLRAIALETSEFEALQPNQEMCRGN